MVKWQATLSTTEPYNYIGIQNVRQGNRNTEVLEAILVENALPLDLTGCEVFFESVIDNKYPIQRSAKIVNAKKGIIHYTFDEYSMQSLHRQEAYFSIHKGDNLIGATQNFSYFVVNAASKTEGEMGSYWQSIEDLIADMTAFINENKGDFTDWMNARKEEFEAWREAQKTDFTSWFESIKDILKTIDPGGTMLAELMDARVDIQGVRHNSISERLLADMEYLYQKLEKRLYTLEYGEISDLIILQDDAFSLNHETEIVGTVEYPATDGALVIATIDDTKQNTYMFGKIIIDKILSVNPYIIGKTDWLTGTCKVFSATKIGIEINGIKKDIVPSNELKTGTFKYYVGKTIQLGDQVEIVLYDSNNNELVRQLAVVQGEGGTSG